MERCQDINNISDVLKKLHRKIRISKEGEKGESFFRKLLFFRGPT